MGLTELVGRLKLKKNWAWEFGRTLEVQEANTVGVTPQSNVV